MAGITFTYGGLKTDVSGRVLNNENLVMPGLWAIGEIQGGFFAHNYPGGAGLMRGSIWGRISGTQAALRAQDERQQPMEQHQSQAQSRL